MDAAAIRRPRLVESFQTSGTSFPLTAELLRAHDEGFVATMELSLHDTSLKMTRSNWLHKFEVSEVRALHDPIRGFPRGPFS